MNRLLEYAVTILIIMLVVALGVFAINQTLEFRYKSELLQAPCSLCTQLNPQFEDCFSFKIAVPGQAYEYNESVLKNVFKLNATFISK